jgi:hypothetical protein
LSPSVHVHGPEPVIVDEPVIVSVRDRVRGGRERSDIATDANGSDHASGCVHVHGTRCAITGAGTLTGLS